MKAHTCMADNRVEDLAEKQDEKQDSRLKHKMEDASSTKDTNSQANKLSPGLEKDSQASLLYKKAPGSADTEGLEFEWTMAALLYLRLLKSGLKFHLATNLEGAGQLDDIVVRFKELSGQWTTLFVQMKHRKTEKLAWHMLTSKKDGSKFSLPIYFKSYLEIKKAMSEEKREIMFEGSLEKCQIVIFTNAKASGKLGEKPVTATKDLSTAEKFLCSGSGSVFSFESDKEMLECLGEHGDEGKEFLKQIRVFCGQPNLDKMKEAFKEEIGNLYPNINIERICECILYNAKVWWETSNEILHENHNFLQTAINKVRLQTCSEQTLKDYVLPLEFENSALLKFGDGLVHIVSSDSSCRVTLTKLLQSTQRQALVLSAQQLRENQPALLAESKNGDKRHLIVLAKDSVQFDVINDMLKSLRDHYYVLFLADGDNSNGNGLTERCERYEDNFKISQLKPESKDKILNKVVNHQGHEVIFGTLFNNDYGFLGPRCCLDHLLTASLVVDILESVGPLTVGTALPEGIEYYVERTLEQPCEKAIVFRELPGTVTIQITKSEASNTGYFVEALDLDFVKSIKDSPSLDHDEKQDNGQIFSKISPETAMDVKERLFLVCAEPGMGKSTLMARLAKNTKAALPHYFVILIALNDHTKLFADGKHEDALEFLSIAAKMDSPLQRSLLKFALEVSGNVVVILDGFDEIAPKFVRQSCYLLSNLIKKTNARKIWMTSRNSVKVILEKYFCQFSAKLCEFDKEEQKTFLEKYWAGKTSEDESIALADRLIEKLAQAIGDKERNFLGIPLQTRMLAEVYEDHVTKSAKKIELPDKLDVLSLMEKFVELKYNIYFREKLKITAENPNEEEIFKMSRKDFIGNHAKAALILIFDSKDINILGLGWILTETLTFFNEIERGAYKTGFIDEIVNDKPRFIHRVFAEYFVANWLAKEFVGNFEFVQSKMFTPDFTVIRYFFNGILAKNCVLHTAVLQENVEQVKTLLESEDVEAQDVGGRTALHLSASLGASENRVEDKRRREILDLIIGKTIDFKVVDKVLCASPLRYADITRWWTAIDKLLCKTDDNGQLILTLEDVRHINMLDTILKQDLDKLLGFCLDNGLEVEHRCKVTEFWVGRENPLLVKACETGSVKVASLLIERDANINKTESDEKYYYGPLTSASREGHMEIVKLLCAKYVSTSLSDGIVHPDASKYIDKKDKYGRTAIHHATVKGQTEVINFLKSQGGDAQSRDGYNKTPLHMAAEFNQLSAMRILLEFLEDADRAAAVNSCDKHGKSVLHLSVLEGSLKCVQLLVQAGGRLSLVNRCNETPLITAALRGKKEVVKWMLDNFNEESEGITLVEYINMKDKDGKTAWDRADTKCREVIANFRK